MSNYIFLDIDGVLNCGKGLENYESLLQKNELILTEMGWIEKPLLRQLHDFVYKTDSKIVGVSSWFINRDKVREISKAIKLPIFAISYNVGGGYARGLGVLNWLKDNHYDHKKDKFVIFDNDTECHTMYFYPSVQINGYEGLSASHIKQAFDFYSKEQKLSDYFESQNKGMEK